MFVGVYEPLYIAIYASLLSAGKLLNPFLMYIGWELSLVRDGKTIERRLGLGMEFIWAGGYFKEAKLYDIFASPSYLLPYISSRPWHKRFNLHIIMCLSSSHGLPAAFSDQKHVKGFVLIFAPS